MNTEYKLYAERDIMQLDKAGNYYCKHLMAMTAEGLHSKSDIAAELAYRDSVIAELEGQLAGANTLIIAQRASIDEMTKQLANREPFVVAPKEFISALVDADHLAVCASKLLLSINKVDSAGCKLDTLIGNDDEYAQQLDVVDQYNSERSERWSAVKNAIYEYERRATKAKAAITAAGGRCVNMIESVSTQLPPPMLTANEIMQRLQAMLNPIISLRYPNDTTAGKLLDEFVQLKRDVWGSSDG